MKKHKREPVTERVIHNVVESGRAESFRYDPAGMYTGVPAQAFSGKAEAAHKKAFPERAEMSPADDLPTQDADDL